MSKYYKAEDVINAIEGKIAEYIPTLYGRYGEIPLELRMAIEHLPTIEVSKDCISKHDIWKIIEDNAYWVRYNENSTEKGMTLTGINQALNECPPVTPTERTGEWTNKENAGNYCSFCGSRNRKEYVKRDSVLELVKKYIEYAEEHADNSGYYEAQFEGFEELQDDLFNLNDTDEIIKNLHLEIEVSEDCISRANLIESFLADCECKSREEAKAVTLKLEDMLELIDDAPSVIPTPSADRPQEWIPCSERLPSENQAVLICDIVGVRFTGKLIRTDTGYKWSIPLFATWMDVEDGDAWMPLPEPCRVMDDVSLLIEKEVLQKK